MVQTTNTPNFLDSNIKLLPEHLIDQIKAGEVVERPASLIKELIENSIDAGSTKIDIHIVDNGMELISIEDNGKGMRFEDLPMAFCRHATSKIERFEDLYKLHSFGFRGEALASIASTARVTCHSQTENESESGGRIVIHGGEQKSHAIADKGSSGTSFFIKDLFFNTPARLKFIKSKNSEKIALKRMVNSFILANPSVAFSVRWDDKEKIFYPAVTEDNFAQRIKKVFFNNKKIDDSLISFDASYEGHRVYGYLSLTSGKGNAGKHQFLFANKRIFHDKSLHQSIMRSAEKMWPFGERGHYVLFIDAPPSAIDVNVHPNKTHIKFFKSGVIYSLIQSGINNSLSIRKDELPVHEQPELQTPNMSFNDAQSFDFSTPMKSNSEWGFTPSPQGFLDRSADRSSLFIRVSDNFFLYKKEGQSFLGDLERLQKSYLTKLFCSPEVKSSEVVPLLISEPFNIDPKSKSSEWVRFLLNKGFEFEQLEPHLIVLRSIPELLSGLALKDILSPVLSELQQSNEELSNELFSRIISKTEIIPLSESSYQTIFNKFSLKELQEANTIKELTEKTLEDFFK
ncbi:MAG: DNA mismatch repair endonuclease MutL [Bacteriovoracaceae bacterium]|nr:DNA mismatch repair endonuclease MutL [Bacteriovoracaceae bacterium]